MLDVLKEIETAAEARKILDIADEIFESGTTTNTCGFVHIIDLSRETHKSTDILKKLLFLNCWREVLGHEGYFVPVDV
jgi:hypothetical protein